MNYSSILTNLYYLLLYADGSVNPKEVTSIKQMIKAEGLNERDFNAQMLVLPSKDKTGLFNESIAGLKKLTHVQQVRIVAWLCVAANADGFMERTEWQFIYRVYHKELALPLNEIFAVQKDLNKIIWEQSTLTIL
jgi:uncharacterized tellurite resistance protein B-like protein